MKIFYNPHTNELVIPEDKNFDCLVLLGLDFYWVYVGEL